MKRFIQKRFQYQLPWEIFSKNRKRFIGQIIPSIAIISCFLIFFLAVLSCSENTERKFVKLPSSKTGITFKNQLDENPELNILTYLYYYNGGGVAAADFNNDNLVDLYFTSNQGHDKLYLNQGDFEFVDITETSNILNSEGWTTGVSHVDINNDGFLDIYICKVGKHKNIQGKNLLYINQGLNQDGVPSFKEAAASYNLDFSGFSTQSTFFDYDLDGDLDMFLLNHSVYPNRNYGKGSKRKEVDSLSGDRLYKNIGGRYVDVSKEAGIFQGSIGYGLGQGVADVNNDGYPDIYVGNDFFENDYLYINQQNGSFKEIISDDHRKLGHTTHFSMGNDLADMNNDGMIDIISVDMLPEELETYKTSGREFDYPTYQYYLKNGYAPQFMQNTFHLNMGNQNFSEIAELSGISATEWSWAPLCADFDNDGFKDLFVSNGILGATNDMDYINFISNEDIQNSIDKGMSEDNMEIISKIPEKKVANYFFKNNHDLTFSNVSKEWIAEEKSFSNGAIYADLDNDGDLDIVVNNLNSEAFVLENKGSQQEGNQSLKVSFKGPKNNIHGIGCKVIVHAGNIKITQENFVSRGYLSAIPSTMTIGVGKNKVLDSLLIIWPGGAYQKLASVKTDSTINVNINNAGGNFFLKTNNENKFLKQVESLIDFSHKDMATIEFNRDPLVPFANTNEGPTISVADVNNDGLEDIFIGGAKKQTSKLFIQNSLGKFDSSENENVFSKDMWSEDTSSVFFDANSDGYDDLLVVSGGNEFKMGKNLNPRLYLNSKGRLKKIESQFGNIEINASKVDTVDFDNDGDIDITITSDQVPHQFGITPRQYLLENDGHGGFQDVTKLVAEEFHEVGNVKDFLWLDIDKNGFKDLIVVGNWMPISIFMNVNGKLEKRTSNGLDETNGWWNTVLAEDFDNDGDIDIVAGNWGKNSKFTAKKEQPISLYNADFDDNTTFDPLVTYFYQNTETPFASKDELVKQLPYLNKEFLKYQDFAKASITDLFPEEKLSAAIQKKVFELGSALFENKGDGNFSVKLLPPIAQASTIHDIAAEDFDNDGFKDLLIVGNTFEISTQLGRMDALHGVILQNDQKMGFHWLNNQNLNISGQAREIQKIKIKDSVYFIVAMQNDYPVFLVK